MNRQTIGTAILAFTVIACAASPRVAKAQQVSNDRKAMQADSSKSSADAKEVKRLDGLAAQAIDRQHQAHKVYMQKIAARETDVKSFGPKDSRTLQAGKDESSAKQDWEASIKQEKDIAGQRKAAIDKLHASNQADRNDVNKLESDEHQKSTTKKP